jgi:hypothetical protein
MMAPHVAEVTKYRREYALQVLLLVLARSAYHALATYGVLDPVHPTVRAALLWGLFLVLLIYSCRLPSYYRWRRYGPGAHNDVLIFVLFLLRHALIVWILFAVGFDAAWAVWHVGGERA